MTAPLDPDLYILDREDGRKVYHLGSLGLPKDMDPSKMHHLGPYTDGPLNFTVGQYCHTTATDRTKRPVNIVRSPSQIVAANRMFPYGDTGCRVASPPAYADFAGPMDTAWLTKYMPTTGERPDIGLITDASAFFMLGKTASGMIAAAHAAGSCPMHFRDESTGRPVDLFKYPQANSYMDGGQGSPHLLFGPADPDGYCRPYPMTPQQAHYTEMSYLAYCATLDAGFLEDLQYSTNFTTGISDASHSTATKTITSGELRGLAWAFRNLFMCHTATMDAEATGTLPASCHPSSYWKTLLDNQLAVYSKIMTDPTQATFRLVGGGNRFGPWQVDYMLMALAFGVLTGHSDWAPLYVWALGNAIARTNGTSGYPPGWGGAYYLNTCEWVKKSDGSYDQGAYDASKPLDWYGSFLFQVNDPNGAQPTAAQIATLKADPLNGGNAITGHEYLMTTRAVLVVADYLEKKELANVRAAYPDLDTCLANVQRMFLAYGSVNPRLSVISTAPIVVPPVTTPPPVNPPPPHQPATEGTIMSNTGSIKVGESGFFDLIDLNGVLADKPVWGVDAPEQLATIEYANDAGTSVKVTGVASGTAPIHAKFNGEHIAAGTLTVTDPLATTGSLSFRAS